MALNARLCAALQRMRRRFEADGRCQAMCLWGSAASGAADEHSDLDVSVVLADEAYDPFVAGLKSLCEEVCGPIEAWLPEGQATGFCNWAFLYRDGDDVLLVDLLTVSASEFERRRMDGGCCLFDRRQDRRQPAAPAFAPGAEPSRLSDLVQRYWVYAYLNGKYARRGDVFKLLYVQHVLMETHMAVLGYVHSFSDWGWWARDAQRLAPSHRADILRYFPAAEPSAVVAALLPEAAAFGRDAREACKRWSVPYPEHTERAVLEHLRRVPGAGCTGTAR